MEERGIGEKEKDHILNRFWFDVKGHPFAADLVASGTSLAINQVPGNTAGQAKGVRKVNTVLKEVVADAAPSKPVAAAAIEGGLWVSVSRRRGFRRLHRMGGCWYSASLVEYPRTEAEANFQARCDRCWSGTSRRR